MKQITTSRGTDLILRGLAGATINFTKIKFGNGEEQGINAVDLSNPIMELGITSITRSENFITLKTAYKNADVPTGFSAHEIGVFARDPDDESKEILYCLWYEEDPVKADYISSVEDRILGTEFEFLVFVHTVENVTAVVAESAEYAKQSDLNAHTSDNKNPHNVDKYDIGLGNVPNVTPENQKPAFDETIGPIDVTVERDPVTEKTRHVTYFHNIEPGDLLGEMLQKMRTAISVLANHINASNPHDIYAEIIGAADRNHFHSAYDINKGVLSIARGGTGCTSKAELMRSLGFQSGSGTITGVAGKSVTLTVEFPHAYTSTPRVVLTPKTDMLSTDVYLSVPFTAVNAFHVQLYSESHNPVIAFNWIAIP